MHFESLDDSVLMQVHEVTRRLQNCKGLTSNQDIIAKSIAVRVCTVDEYQVLFAVCIGEHYTWSCSVGLFLGRRE